MSANTAIEWCDHTFNPWEGCQKVGPGCDHCYAETRNARFGGGVAVNWGPAAPRRRTGAENWGKPVKWNAQAAQFQAEHGRRQRVFCASLADVFDNAVDPAWRLDLFKLIAATPHLDWLLLTKRIGNVAGMLGDYRTVPLLPNIWLGITVVNQDEADRDIPKLLAVPARVRFLSIEPMLGPIELTKVNERRHGGFNPWHCMVGYCMAHYPKRHCGCPRQDAAIDWVIVGGESGPGARPMHPDWARSLRDQCAAAGVPFLFKQWGEWREPHVGEAFSTAMGRAQKVPAFIVAPTGTVHCFENDQTRNGGKAVLRVGKKAAGRLLDGRTHDGFPGAF